MFLNLYISIICICFGFRTSNFEFLVSQHAESIYVRAYKALHLSRTLYKSATFYAKQTQFSGRPNEHKYFSKNDL